VRIVNVGISETEICGVRGYAQLLADDLRKRGHEVADMWLERAHVTRSLDIVRATRSWASELTDLIRVEKPEVLLWHYSVFTYGLKGVPVLAPMVSRALRASGVPVVGLLHEFAYPWEIDGGRGVAWALTQRAVLPMILRNLDGAIVTTEGRGQEVRAHRAFAAKPIMVAPVYSLLPTPQIGTPADDRTVGVIAWRDDGMAPIAIEAIAKLRATRPDLRVVLLGAPGPESRAGRAWRNAAQRASQQLEFTGIVAGSQSFADEAARCSVIVFADSGGPSSRKTTVASALAFGVPTVAFKGPETWQALADTSAVALVPYDGARLSGALGALLDSDDKRAALGREGREFYKRHQSVDVTGRAIAEFLRAVTG
jgi:glycosyltransferase involved in cell wall biosynthesis